MGTDLIWASYLECGLRPALLPALPAETVTI